MRKRFIGTEVVVVLAIGVLLYGGLFYFLTTLPVAESADPPVLAQEEQQFGESGTIRRLNQWGATTSPQDAITTRVHNKDVYAPFASSTWESLIVTNLQGSGTRCIEVDGDGALQLSSLACSSGGAAFAWTPYTDGVATSTLLRFDNGFISQASSTIDSNLNVRGALSASSTLSIANLATFDNQIDVLGTGTSTIKGGLKFGADGDIKMYQESDEGSQEVFTIEGSDPTNVQGIINFNFRDLVIRNQTGTGVNAVMDFKVTAATAGTYALPLRLQNKDGGASPAVGVSMPDGLTIKNGLIATGAFNTNYIRFQSYDGSSFQTAAELLGGRMDLPIARLTGTFVGGNQDIDGIKDLFVIGGDINLGDGTATTTLTVDSTGNLGVGTTTPTSALHVEGSLSRKLTKIFCDDSPYTAGDEVTIIADTTGCNITINLPALASVDERVYHTKNIGNQTLFVVANSSDLIDGASTSTVNTQYDAPAFQADIASSTWHII